MPKFGRFAIAAVVCVQPSDWAARLRQGQESPSSSFANFMEEEGRGRRTQVAAPCEKEGCAIPTIANGRQLLGHAL